MRIYNSIRFLPPFLALFFPFLLHAQEQDGGPLEEIIVTPSRLPVPARRIATSVTVMTADDIAAHGNLSLTDVLRQTPAVAASGYGGAGKATVLRIRGEEGFRTLVMFDGIRLLDPSIPQVGPQFEHVMSSGVGRLEVLRGPQGLGYGADAGGVIAISSPRVTAPLQLNLDAQGGRFHTRRVTGDVAAGGDRADVFIAVADLDTAGFNAQAADTAADADGYDNTTLHARAGVNLGSGWRLDVIHRHVDGATRFDGCFAATLVHDCSADYTLKASRLALAYSGDGFSHGLAWAGTRTDQIGRAHV